MPSAGGRPLAASPAEPTPIEQVVEALRGIAVLDGLTEQEYRWFATHSTERVGEDGALIFCEDQPSFHMTIILRGDVMVHRRKSGPVSRFVGRTAHLTGKLPFSRMKSWGADGRCVGEVWVLDIHQDLFGEMLQVIPSMGQRSVTLLLDRVRDFTRMDEQAEKLLALGKLAANLSHELNNPASAAQRSASMIAAELVRTDEAKYRLGRMFTSEEQLEQYHQWFRNLQQDVRNSFEYSALPRSPLEASDREQELSEWLAAHGVMTPWEYGPILAEMCVTTAKLEQLEAIVGPSVLPMAITTVSGSLQVEAMSHTVMDSSERIFELISAIRGYSFMDQAPVQEIDLVESIRNVLAMFRSRMNRVETKLESEPELPLVSAYGSELNQVWSALIENALDAMHDEGILTIAIRCTAKMVLVEVRDNGPGIQPEIQSRIFEPFFTTKPLGTAMGLGLDTVQRIVGKHAGSVAIDSRPHATCFQIRLPVNLLQAY
ncbi:MAG: ATP-binding protein [Edaphobacter sp.]|uniref:ATP-binding protein n=1 Tax=Edaphobacter sp. TaxID=1934404 RepID=UPI0023854D07|nr:ATP-binding protein [Edaphobacter sp.]MDE1177210.1 ATP-binding protein [Edaphobacter sp.]